MKKIYFPNLNGLRFFFATFVILGHVEQIKSSLGLSNLSHISFFNFAGPLSVTFFFVLSGFLITYLLLEEINVFNTVNIRAFIWRRILRIWPLYYLLTFLGFFVLPNIDFFYINDTLHHELYENYYTNLGLFLLILPNIATIHFNEIPYISQAWSIGVEEQFYLLWPFLMYIKTNRIITILVLIFIYLFFNSFGVPFLQEQFGDHQVVKILKSLFRDFKFNSMAIGGVFAYLLHTNSKYLKLLFHKIVEVPTYLLIVFFVFIKGIYLPHIHTEFYSVLGGILIINMAANPKRLFSLENKLFNFLGKVSYGLYMLHYMAIVIVLKIMLLLNIPTNFGLDHILSVLLTIFIAWLSYEYFEKFFIKRKKKYTKIKSGAEI
jgi:peptidoglycan/LPS O-acetylase OafA/YrhL